MLASITWTTFVSSLLLLLTLYYLVIAYRFYLPGLLVKNKPSMAVRPSVLLAKEDDHDRLAYQAVDLSQTDQEPEYQEAERVDHLITVLKDEIAIAAEKTIYKAELMMQIKPILSTYHDLKDSPYQPAINELLLTETKILGSMALREEDVVELWDA